MKRIVALLVLFVLVFNGACLALNYAPKPVPVKLSEPMRKHIWIDATFSAEEQADIIRAYKTIECSTNYSLVQFTFTTGAGVSDLYLMQRTPSIVVINATSEDPRIKLSDKNIPKGKHTVGLFVEEEIPVVLLPKDRIPSRDLFYKIALHEGIHSSLNILRHSDNNASIMFPSIDETSSQDISEEDFIFICEFYACDPSTFRKCSGNIGE